MSAEQALEIFFSLCVFFKMCITCSRISALCIYRHGERKRHQLPVTAIFHLFEQMPGCQKDKIFYSYQFLLQIAYMSVFHENFIHLRGTFFTIYFFLTAMA